jgi:hypothetical protein
MDAHDLGHKLAPVRFHIDEAMKDLAPFYSTLPGVDVKEHLLAAASFLDGIDSQLLHELLNKEG